MLEEPSPDSERLLSVRLFSVFEKEVLVIIDLSFGKADFYESEKPEDWVTNFLSDLLSSI